MTLRSTCVFFTLALTALPSSVVADCHDGSPLILDLNGDGIRTSNVLYQPVRFDIDGDGRPEEVGWTDPYSEEAFLWLDLDLDGRVDGGPELFGNATLLPSGELAEHGFEALAAYDDLELGGNLDGRIDARDEVWSRLRLWVDRSHDGRADRGEIHSLSGQGVVWLPLDYEHVPEAEAMDGNVNFHELRSVYAKRHRHPAFQDELPVLEHFLIEDVFFRHRQP